MIYAAWRRWVETRQLWWLILLGCVLLLDVVVGSWLLSKELELVLEVWSG